MVVGLVDTPILIDVLRGYGPAGVWLQQQTTLGITPGTSLELIAGARNKSKQLEARRLLKHFEMIYLTEIDQAWAMQQMTDHALKHGVGVLDCLIAAPSYRLQLPLYTQNLKHFTPLLGALAQKPY